MGLARYQQINVGAVPSSQGLPLMEEFAARIDRIDPSHPSVALLRGLAAEHAGDLQTTVRNLRIARNGDPTDYDATFWLSVSSFSTGQVPLGRCLARELAAVDPLNPFPVVFDAYGAFFEGRAAQGVGGLRRSLELGGRDVPGILWGGARILAAAGDREGAASLRIDLETHHPDAVFTPLTSAFLRALDGDLEAVDLIVDSHGDWARSAAEWAQSMADVYALLGLTESAMEWLLHAHRIGFLNWEFLATRNPFLVSLRREKLFAELVERMRADHVRFEATLEDVECAS